MPFGLTVAGYALQYKLNTIFNYLDCCAGITDHLTIWDKEVDRSGHDKATHKVLAGHKTAHPKTKLRQFTVQDKASEFLFHTIHI